MGGGEGGERGKSRGGGNNSKRTIKRNKRHVSDQCHPCHVRVEVRGQRKACVGGGGGGGYGCVCCCTVCFFFCFVLPQTGKGRQESKQGEWGERERERESRDGRRCEIGVLRDSDNQVRVHRRSSSRVYVYWVSLCARVCVCVHVCVRRAANTAADKKCPCVVLSQLHTTTHTHTGEAPKRGNVERRVETGRELEGEKNERGEREREREGGREGGGGGDIRGKGMPECERVVQRAMRILCNGEGEGWGQRLRRGRLKKKREGYCPLGYGCMSQTRTQTKKKTGSHPIFFFKDPHSQSCHTPMPHLPFCAPHAPYPTANSQGVKYPFLSY